MDCLPLCQSSFGGSADRPSGICHFASGGALGIAVSFWLSGYFLLYPFSRWNLALALSQGTDTGLCAPDAKPRGFTGRESVYLPAGQHPDDDDLLAFKVSAGLRRSFLGAERF